MLDNNKKMNKSKAFLCVALFAMISGCQDKSMSDLKSFVDNAFKDEQPEIEPLPVVIPFTPFEYSAGEENDPFSSANIVSEGGGGAAALSLGESPDANRRKEELENYPLDALSMVGTLSKKNKPWVIIKTNQGSVLLATVGNYVGENYGKITQISTEEQVVTLTETVPDPSGRWVARDVQITVEEQ